MGKKLKYDVSGVEGSADFEPPKPGIYKVKVDEVEDGTSKSGNSMLTVTFRVVGGDFDNAPLWHYIVTEEGDEMGARRLKEFIAALGKRVKGTIDLDAILGEEMQVRVKSDSYEGEYKARVGKVMAAADDDDDEDDDEPDDDEPDEEEEKPKRSRRKKAEPEPEPDDDDDDDDDDEEDDYDTWNVAELDEELKERGLKTGGTKARKIARLRKDDEDDDGSEPF